MIVFNLFSKIGEDLTPKEQEQVGNWLRRTPLEALGLGEVREAGKVQETRTA